jgi:2-dehydropantoate 2-reductase
MPRCDVVVIAWKTTQNRALAETLPHLVKPGGFVLVLQNGLDPERDAAPHAGGAHVLGGLCFLSSRKVGPGHVLHQDYGTITLAAYPGGTGDPGGAAAAISEEVTAGLRGIAEDLGRGGVETRILAEWRAARWRKLVWNVPFNGLCALHGLDTRALLERPRLKAEARDLMEEVLAGAAREGHVLPLNFADRMLADTGKMVPYEPSMKLDRDAGRPMELEAIYERTLEAIRKAGGTAPHMGALLRDLRAI